MQPRSLPSWVSVTKVARAGLSQGSSGSGLSVGHAQRRLDAVPRDVEQRAPMLLAETLSAVPERERGVADHPPATAGGVAGIAQIEQLHLELMAPGREQHARDRRRAAGLLVVDVGGEIEDRLRSAAVDRAGLVVGMVVRQIRTDDDQGFRAAPEPLDHLGHLRRRGRAYGQRHQAELAQHALQERQLHLERMLLGMHRAAHDHLRQAGERRDRLPVDAAPGPSGVAKAVASGSARPRTGTRWQGPSSTTRRTIPRAGRSLS